ncbi:MAG: hypothetical protein ACRCZI_09920 [Cetobacterium sp.]
MSGAGWNLKNGEMNPNSDLKEAISNFFSKKNAMNNFYKLLLFKALMEIEDLTGDIFYESSIYFAELYFNYKKDYPITINKYNGKSKISAADTLIENFYKKEIYEYENLILDEKVKYILEIKKILKTNVIGAFYKSLNELPYSFDIKSEKMILNFEFKDFLDNNKEILNDLIYLRIIEFIKVSEKDEKKLEQQMIKNNILDYKQNFYIQIQKMIDILFE